VHALPRPVSRPSGVLFRVAPVHVIKGSTHGRPRPEKVAVVEECRALGGSSARSSLSTAVSRWVTWRPAPPAAHRRRGLQDLQEHTRAARGDTPDTRNSARTRYLKDRRRSSSVVTTSARSRRLRDFARVHPQLVVKGVLLGTQLLDANGANALATFHQRFAGPARWPRIAARCGIRRPAQALRGASRTAVGVDRQPGRRC